MKSAVGAHVSDPSLSLSCMHTLQLKPPFLKVEDNSGLYRPLVYQMQQWPTPDLHGVWVPSPTPGPAAAPVAKGPLKPGYCECCKMRYTYRKLHLQGKKHKEYATNPENFASLDQFVVEKRLDHESFLESLRKKYVPKAPVKIPVTVENTPAIGGQPLRKVCAELSKNRVKRRLAFPGKREKGRRRVFSVMQPAEKENGHILQDVASPKPVKKRVRQQKRVKLSKELLDLITRDSPLHSSSWD